MATNMTHLAPLTWRGFCLATPAPSAGSLRMPVGCPVLTQRRPLVSFSGGRVRTQARRGGKRAGVSRVGRVRRRVAKAGNCLRAGNYRPREPAAAGAKLDEALAAVAWATEDEG